MGNRFRLAVVLAVAPLLLSGCSREGQRPGTLRIVATHSVLGDLVKNVASDSAEVTTLVGPDGDAHTYEPTPSDAKAISTARLVVINGLGLEGWLTRLMGAAKFSGTRVTATEGITPLTMQEAEGGRFPQPGG